MQIRFYKFTYKAFSLVELLTIVAIISIIAAFSVPAYLRHIATTKINSLWTIIDAQKQYLNEQFFNYNIDPTTTTINQGTGNVSYSTELASCLTVQNGIITVRMNPDSIHTTDIWVSATPTVTNGQITWACNYSSVAAEYIAASVPDCSVGTENYSADPFCD